MSGLPAEYSTTVENQAFLSCHKRVGRRRTITMLRLSSMLTRRTVNVAPRRALSSSDTVIVGVAEAEQTTKQALRMIGWDEEDASLQAAIMTSAELCGNNQGLVKMFQPQLMAPAPGAGKPTVERDAPATAVVNANQAPGMLAAVRHRRVHARRAPTPMPDRSRPRTSRPTRPRPRASRSSPRTTRRRRRASSRTTSSAWPGGA